MKTELISRHTLQSLTLPTSETITEVGLQDQELLKTRADGRMVNVYVYSGNVWVTQEGDSNDHFLTPGEAFVTDRRGMVILQGMPSVRIRITRH